MTFNSIEKTPQDVAALILTRQNAGYPFVVARESDHLLGFSTYGQFRTGSGYAWTMEHTVILDPEARGRGIGRALLAHIETIAQERKIRSMIACVSGDNADAIAFHQRLGYVETGRVQQAGYKLGKWLDTVFLQKML